MTLCAQMRTAIEARGETMAYSWIGLNDPNKIKAKQMKSRIITIMLLIGLLLPAVSCQAQTPGTLYQLSTIRALQQGDYDGRMTLGALKQKGNLGIGTFDALDGEMILLEGQFYQVKDTGVVETPADAVTTPFAAVAFFAPDLTVDLGAVANLAALKTALEKLMPDPESLYLLRVDGTFAQIRVRSVARQQKPYPGLGEVIKNPPMFDYQNVKGTLVGTWAPAYVGDVNTPGYNLHFISDDRTQGGHLVEATLLAGARVSLQAVRRWEIELSAVGK